MNQLLWTSAEAMATMCQAPMNIVTKGQQEFTKLLGQAWDSMQKSKVKAEMKWSPQ